MANNKYSSTCLSISSFDTYLKQNYFPVNSNAGVCNIRGCILEKYSDRPEFNPKTVDSITAKLDAKEALTSEEQEFIRTYAKEALSLLNEKRFQEQLQERIAKAGIKRNAVSTMYKTFKNKFSAEYRGDILDQVVAAVILSIDELSTRSKYKNFSREEILETYGVNKLMVSVRNYLEHHYKKVENPTEEQKKVAETLFTDPEALEAVFFMARNKLFEAEKIKIGIEENSATDEDEGTQFNTDEIQDAEVQGAEHWMLKTDTISSFGSLSKEVRSILYKLTDEKPGILGLPSIVNTLLIHQQLLELREEYACTNSSEFLDALLAIASDENPWAHQLYDILTGKKNKDKDKPINTYLRTMFFNAYRRNHLNYVSLKKDYDTKTGGVIYKENTNKSNPENAYRLYIAQMYDIEDRTLCIFDVNGNIDRNKVSQYRETLTAGSNPIFITGFIETPDFNNWNPDIESGKLDEKKKDFIRTMNAAFNLHLDEVEMEDLMEGAKLNKFTINIIKTLNDIWTNSKISTVDDLVKNSQLSYRLRMISSVSKQHLSVAERKAPSEKSFRFNGSTYMTNTICNHIGDTLERISKAAKEAVAAKDINRFKEFLEDKYLKCRIFATKNGDTYDIHHMWLRELYNSSLEDLQSNNSFFAKFTKGLERGLGMNDKDFEDFTEKENYILCLNTYGRTMLDTEGKFGKFPLFITGDSNSTRFLTAPIIPYGTSGEVITEAFVEVAVQEIERMQMFRDLMEWCKSNKYTPIKGMESKAEKFTILPFLNAHKDTLLTAYNNEGKVAFENAVRSYIQSYLNNGYTTWISELRASKSAKDKPLVAVGKPVLNSQVLTIRDYIHDNHVNGDNFNFLREYYYNYKYVMVQQLQFLTVDPGFYDGTNEMQKRYKEMIAAGTPLDSEALDPSDPTKKIDDKGGVQDVVYAEEQKFDTQEEIIKALDTATVGGGARMFRKEDIENFKKSTGTDGQAWRSFRSYRKIMIMLGKWTPAMEEVWTIIQEARTRARENGTVSRLTTKKDMPNGEDGELERILKLGVVFQPIKPFYYGIESIETEGGKGLVQIPVQHKCSEFPVIPELLPEGNPLAELGRAMEMEDESSGRYIDLVICTSAVKVGNFGAANIKGLTDSKSIREALNAGYTHQLSLDNWREQSNVPEHADCSRQLGSQLRLHWLSNIAGVVAKKYPKIMKTFGKKIWFTRDSESIDISEGLSEGNLVELYNNLAANGFVKSFMKLRDKLSNPNEMSDLLSTLRANDTRESDDGIDAYTVNSKGEFNLSPSEGLSAKDNMAAILSHIRKKIIQQGMKGGSLVQVSTYGFQDVLKLHTEKILDGDTEKTNITYGDCVACFDLSVTDANGNIVKLDYLDYVDPNTGNLLKVDGTAFTDKEIDADEDWRSKTKLEHDYPGILDMLAYRIPTEGHCSILNLKIRKFLPLTAGAIVIVPAVYTAIAGFDFDIDKLYFVRREYREKKLSKKQEAARINRVWNDIYGKSSNKGKGTTEIYKRLVAAREKALQQPPKEGSGTIVAQSSNTSPVTLGDLVNFDNIYSSLGFTRKTGETQSEETVVEEPNEPVETTTEEADVEDVNNTKECERLYQYWDAAGLNEPKGENGEGGVGMSAQEYFEHYVTSNANKYREFQKYDEKRPLFEQPQTVINNILFDLYQSRLEDYDTFQERYTPSGFNNLKRARPIMYTINYATKEELENWAKDEKKTLAELTFRDLVEFTNAKYKDFVPEYDALDPATLVHYQTQNALYDKLIGIAANQNINQKFTSLTETFKLKDSIKWGSMLFSTDKGMGNDIKQRYMNTIDPQTNTPMILDTEASSKENLGAAVDAVKDASLEFFGITTNNFNLASLIGKIGATPEDIGLLLNQPVVAVAMGIIESTGGFKDLSSALYEAYEILIGKDAADKKLNNELKMLSANKQSDDVLDRDPLVSLDALTRSIIAYKCNPHSVSKSDDFINTQLAVISILKDLQAVSTIMSAEVTASRTTSVSSVKSDYGSIEITERKAQDLANKILDPDCPFEILITSLDKTLERTIINPDARIVKGKEQDFMAKYMKSAFGMPQAAYSAVMSFIEDVVCKYFPYRTAGFRIFKNRLELIARNGNITSDIVDEADVFLTMYCLERMVPAFMENRKPEIVGATGESITVNMPKRIFYKNFFPVLLLELIKQNQELISAGNHVIDYSEIPILQYITPSRENYKKGIKSSDLILKADTIGALLKDTKNVYIESWEQMLKSEDPILRDIAFHLFMYSYYSGGFKFGTTTFMSLVPLALKVALGNEDGEEYSYVNFYNRLFNIVEADNSHYLEEKGSKGDTRFSIKDVVKSFLANFCTDFYQFSQVVYGESKNDSLGELLVAKSNGGTVNSFEVDFTDEQEKLSLKSLIVDTSQLKEEGKPFPITIYKAKPCIVFSNTDSVSIYICDNQWNSDNLDFTSCNGKITYHRINLVGKNNASDVTLYTNEVKDYSGIFADVKDKLQKQLNEFKKSEEELGNLYDNSAEGETEILKCYREILEYAKNKRMFDSVGLDSLKDILKDIIVDRNRTTLDIISLVKSGLFSDMGFTHNVNRQQIEDEFIALLDSLNQALSKYTESESGEVDLNQTPTLAKLEEKVSWLKSALTNSNINNSEPLLRILSGIRELRSDISTSGEPSKNRIIDLKNALNELDDIITANVQLVNKESLMSRIADIRTLIEAIATLNYSSLKKMSDTSEKENPNDLC